MARPTRFVFVVFDGFELLDVTGPSTVFQAAARLAGKEIYRSIVVTPEGGPIRAAAGLTVETMRARDVSFGRHDFLLVAGAEREPLLAALEDGRLLDCLRAAAPKCGRYGSVCSGAMVLAEAGLVDGRTVSSHWDACGAIADRYPAVSVNPDSIYTKDGCVWTSAGAATGIDMALAVVEEDHGAALSAKVAKRIVVFARRQGNQSQFSSFLEAQTRAATREVRAAVNWMTENPASDTTVSELAGIAGMTERTFYRKFESALGVTPAKFLERLRLDRAKDLLEHGLEPKEVAARVGFRSYSGFRASFLRAFDLSPSAHRALHARQPAL